MAQDNSFRRRGDAGGDVTRRVDRLRKRWRASLLCLIPILALLIALAAGARAQSGRNKPVTSKPSPSAQRQKRARTIAPRRAENASESDQSSKTIKPETIQTPPPTADVQPVRTTPDAAGASQSAGTGTEVGEDEVISINSNLVTIPASVVDEQGWAVSDLKLEDFELRVDGQVKPVADLGRAETPVRLALLFDNSGSVKSAREFEQQAAIKFFRRVMRPVDQAAIYSVSSVSVLEQPLTSNVQTLVRTIESFGKPEGTTTLFDAIASAIRYLKPQQGRKVIVIVSDGEDTTSDLDFETTLRMVQSSDCQIYVVQTQKIEYILQTGQISMNANLRSLAAERRMQELAGQTGGAVYAPAAVKELDAAFAQIAADLAQQYVLSYYPTEELRDKSFRRITLYVKARPNLRVRARRGY